MAQAPRPEQVTPADELRDLLTRVEKQAASIRYSGPAAVNLLDNLDRIERLWPELEAAGVDLRPEAGRWETIQLAVARNARPLLAELRQGGGIAGLRAERHPDGVASAWWRLDEQVAQENKRRLRRSGLIAAAVLGVGLVLYFGIQLLFPVDPHVRAAYEQQAAGERKIQQSADFAGALENFKVAAANQPQAIEAWLRVGAVQQKLGDTAGMTESYRKAQALAASDAEFKLTRSQVFLGFGMVAEAQADIEEALVLAPDNPYVYYTAASVYESQGRLQDALKAIERCADLAQAQDDTQMAAMSRYRLGMLIQQGFAQQVVSATPTAAPAP